MALKLNRESDVAQTLGSDVARTLGLIAIPRYKRWLQRMGIIIILAGIAVGIEVFRRNSEQTSPLQFKTQEVQRGELVIIVTATGTLEPTNDVDLSSELSGLVKSVEVDFNSKVKVGQVLATLDTSKLKAQVTQSKAALEAAKAKVLQAKATVKETRSKLTQLQKGQELSKYTITSQFDLDAADAAFERAKADEISAAASVSQALASLELNEADLAKSVIRSPINGIVLTRAVEPGQTVAASFQAPVLFTLAEDLTQMELHVDVDEADIGKVKEGQHASFSVDAYPNRTFEALIIQSRYGAKTSEGVVSYETVLKVDNADLSLRPGMTATADITVQKIENAVLIPNAALRFIPPVQEEKKPSTGLVGMLLPRPPQPSSRKNNSLNGDKRQKRVWMLQEGQLVAIPVKLGASNGTVTELLQGDLKPGMSVVVDTVSVGR